MDCTRQGSLPFTISGTCSNSCPLSLWWHPTILSSFPPAFHLSQHHGLFQWVGSSHQIAKYWIFRFSISPSREYSGLISFRTCYGKMKIQSRKAHLGRHSRQWSTVYYPSTSQGNRFRTRTPTFSRDLVSYPSLSECLHVRNFFWCIWFSFTTCRCMEN